MRLLVVGALLCAAMSAPVHAADDVFEQLATCRLSWLDFREDPARGHALGDTLRASYSPDDVARDGSWKPTKATTLFGARVSRLYPESLGMGVGFSVLLDAKLDDLRPKVERAVGRPITECERDGAMVSCGLELGEKKTVTLTAADSGPQRNQTLVGCYYFYAQ